MVSGLTNVGDADFERKVINKKKPTIVVCYTPESGLCRIVIDKVYDLTKKYDAHMDFSLMHINDSKDTFFKYRVKELPTILYFKDGALASKLSGIKLTSELSRKIENIMSGEFLLASSELVYLTDDNYKDEILNYEGIALVNFWLSGHEPCWSMESGLKELAKKYKDRIKVCIVNWKEAKDLGTKFRVSDVPTMIFLYKGEELDRVVGLRTKRSIENTLAHYLFKITK